MTKIDSKSELLPLMDRREYCNLVKEISNSKKKRLKIMERNLLFDPQIDELALRIERLKETPVGIPRIFPEPEVFGLRNSCASLV
jgi:hypothetical protein